MLFKKWKYGSLLFIQIYKVKTGDQVFIQVSKMLQNQMCNIV